MSKSTVWDKIYREYLGAGEKYATIGGNLHPLFIDFVKNHNFPQKSALDIGCGEGTYLKYLKDHGFQVAGIDSSAKAVEVTRQLVGETELIQVVDMYQYEIPVNKYDLVVSVAAIHHGRKAAINSLISRVNQALVPGGWTFITISDVEVMKARHKPFREIEPGTFEPLTGPEKGLLHSGFTEEETRKMFSEFTKLNIVKDHKSRWLVMSQK